MDRICTIIALNYLPQAMALLESTRKVYPKIDFYVLIIDATSKDLVSLPSAKVLIPQDLDIPEQWLLEMSFYYDSMELATSLKPFLLKTLLEKGVSTVTFLDPDILLFNKLDEGMRAAEKYGIALTPHRLTPANINGGETLDLGFLQYGIFNLGYISVGQKSKPMLNWWGTRLRWYCTKFPNDAVFTDQKWMNFVPALFEHEVIKHSGYNLATWNIDERLLTKRNGKLYAGAKELVFIHFSQMSGALALGHKTDRWRNALSNIQDSQSTLITIEQMTDGYINRLKIFGNEARADNNNLKLAKPIGYHTKRKIIRQIVKNYENKNSPKHENKEFLTLKHHKLYLGLTLFLEKSSALNGFRDGLHSDFLKIKSRFSRN
jgi:hypothetical protein